MDELRRELGRIEESTAASDHAGQESPGPDPEAHIRRMDATRVITGDRPLLVRPGPLQGFRGMVKRLIRRSVRWYVEDIAVQARSFTEASTRAAAETVRWQADHEAQLAELEAQLAALVQTTKDAERASSGLKDRIARLERREAQTRSTSAAAPAAPKEAPSDEGSPQTVDFDYFGFESVMRGSREEIAERQAGYLEAFSDVDDVLDVGCGRGEFLEALRGAGKRARGIDLDADMVDQCLALGLEARQGDAITYLATLEAGSLGGIFASQVVEHLPPRQLVAFLRGAARALRTDGVIVLETINPGSLSALRNYFADLTHSQPLVPETLAFLCESAGFREVSVEYTSPVPEAGRLTHVPFGPSVPHAAQAASDRNVDLLNALLFAPQDYAVMGRA